MKNLAFYSLLGEEANAEILHCVQNDKCSFERCFKLRVPAQTIFVSGEPLEKMDVRGVPLICEVTDG